MTTFFAGMSSSGMAKTTARRSDTIKHLYEQVQWNDLIKAEILRQRDVSSRSLDSNNYLAYIRACLLTVSVDCAVP